MKKLLWLPICLLIVLAALALPATAMDETKGDLEVMVLDQNDNPIESATVNVYLNGSIVDTGVTNASGQVLLQNFFPGSYLVEAVYEGYNATNSISLLSNETGYLTLKIDIPSETDDDTVDDDIAPADDDDDDTSDGYDDDDDSAPASEDDSKGESMAVGVFSGFVCLIGGIILILVVGAVIFIVVAYNYSKISSQKLMNNETRVKIYDHINRHPGQHLRGIKKDLKLPMGVLTHHITMMEREELIKNKLDGQYKRYYPWNTKIEHKEWLSDIQNHMASVISENPGISPNKVAKKMKISRNNAYYHTAELERKGIIYIDKSGRSHKCFMKQDT